MAQSRHWCGTSFDLKAPTFSPSMRYLVYQQELCPTSARLHWQFFVTFHLKKRLKAVKDYFESAHLEPARNIPKAIEYCKKTDTQITKPVEHGIPLTSIQSQTVLDALRTRTPLELIIEVPNYWRSLNALNNIRMLVAPPRHHWTQGILLHGPTGSGKSRIAHNISSFLGDDQTYTASSDLKWFDGYQGQPLVIVDEFVGKAEGPDLLRLCDRYPLTKQIKGGTVVFNSKLIIFTSNGQLRDWYPTGMLPALRRRIIEIEVSK